ncbi:NPC1-like intracellular cholesterol transporter 1 isoform X5 [Loxodonta africana]|uniref:NPC1-like intracellular cholesterol transporter 1 isoform X5 n=1 Tax=Loxodonta africana TaxID=9785 RepID=UPI0030D3AC3A
MANEVLGFEHMGLDPRLLQAVTDLGWSRPTLIQEKAIPLALEGKDLLARARTGSGKTAAYALPMLQLLLHRKATGPVVEQAVRVLVLVPTKELAKQAQSMIQQLATYCARDIRVADVSAAEHSASQRAVLIEKPDVVVGTPSRILSHLQQDNLKLHDSLELLVMDEADLLFSFGFEEELKSLLCHLPRIYQAFLMSATFNEDVQALKELVLHNPVTLKLQESQLPGPDQLQQFQVVCETEEDKFLLLYALLKLSLIRGKSLLFVNTLERSYRLRLFLEQFSIPACVLNGELPLRSRCHIISQFNQGFYDCVIATDAEVLGAPVKGKHRGRGAKGDRASDPEAGVARGIDFHHVSAVLNFDLPPTPEAYIHRAGRTARASNPGVVLTFVLPAEQAHLGKIEELLSGENGVPVLLPYQFRMEEIEGFRYRCRDAMRSVTKQAIREARLKEVKEELLRSEKLKTYFEDNPRDLQLLRHDLPLHPAVVKPHLGNVPDYLVPPTLRGVVHPHKKRKKPPSSYRKVKAQAQPYTPIHQAGYCALYEECGKNPELPGSLAELSNVPCLSNTPARHVAGQHLILLRRICPRLYNGLNTTYACCSSKQLESLELSLAITKALLTRCPACSDNFVSLHCQNTCSPNQSLFINVTRVFQLATGQPAAVLAYQAFYQRSFAEHAYDSCSLVRIPAAASLAVGTMCGVYGSALCNAQRWLNFQGDTSNGLAPLEITFHLLDPSQAPGNGIQLLNSEIVSCNESQGIGSPACSCQDCATSCPDIAHPQALDATFRFGQMAGALALVIILCSALVVLVAFLVQPRLAHCRDKDKDKDKAVDPGVHTSFFDRLSFATHKLLSRFFQAWGTWVASWPLTILGVSIAVVLGLAGGLAFVELTTDPVELWSAPNSQARWEKEFHDQHFGPFFRTNQVILTAPGRASYLYDSLLLGPKNFSGVLSPDLLLELLELQERLRQLQVWSPKEQRNVSLGDICYAPLNPHNATLSDCCVNSLLQYFQNNRSHLLLTANQTLMGQTSQVDWRDHFLYCVNAPLTFKDGTALGLSCMADYGAPVFPFLAVGGYKGKDYSEAEALIMTFSLNNYLPGDPRLAQVKLWELGFLEEVRAFQRRMAGTFQVTFMVERSLEDEINRTTWEDLPIFATSYIVIFLYIALALGSYSSRSRRLVDSKGTLGLGGVAVVLGAVMAAIGFFSYLGVPSSLIILQVVPFLVLAVGADNIFIFVLEYQRLPRKPGERREQHIGRTLGHVGPSMLLCSISEAICFFLGMLTPMPAVRTFALTCGFAVVLDFLLQMLAFVALLSLDSKRQEASRLDVCCCRRAQQPPQPSHGEGLLLRFFRHVYVPVLLHKVTRAVVVVLFLALFGVGLYYMFYITVGLDQELTLPKDSYLLDYFLSLNRYFEVGAPIYFVTTAGYNFSSTAGMNGICSSAGCDSYSLTQKIQYATEFPELLPIHGLPHAPEELTGLHGSPAGVSSPSSQHHCQPAEGPGDRPSLRGLPLHDQQCVL